MFCDIYIAVGINYNGELVEIVTPTFIIAILLYYLYIVSKQLGLSSQWNPV